MPGFHVVALRAGPMLSWPILVFIPPGSDKVPSHLWGTLTDWGDTLAPLLHPCMVSAASFLAEYPVHPRRLGELLRGARLQCPGEVLHSYKPLQPGQAEHHPLRVTLDVGPFGREAVRAGD